MGCRSSGSGASRRVGRIDADDPAVSWEMLAAVTVAMVGVREGFRDANEFVGVDVPNDWKGRGPRMVLPSGMRWRWRLLVRDHGVVEGSRGAFSAIFASYIDDEEQPDKEEDGSSGCEVVEPEFHEVGVGVTLDIVRLFHWSGV